MPLFALLAFVVLAVLIMIGSAIAIFIAITGGTIAVAGIVISSVTAAVSRKNIKAGITVLTLEVGFLTGAMLGALAGVLCSWLLDLPLLNLKITATFALVGAVLTAAAGYLMGHLWYRLGCNAWKKLASLNKRDAQASAASAALTTPGVPASPAASPAVKVLVTRKSS